MYNSGGVVTEWQLLLELNTHEAEEWLKGQGMEINAVLEAPVYQKIQEAVLELKTKDQPPKLDRTPISIGEPTIPTPNSSSYRGNGKQEKVEAHVQAKLNLWEKCLGINEIDFDWLVKALSWEYEQSKFELSFQKRLRFKHVHLTPSGKLALSEVDAEELPPFLSYLKELHPEEMVFEVRNYRGKKRVFASFSIIEIKDTRVTLSVKGFDMEILPGATANLLLPAENILLRTLLDQWENSIEKNQLLSAQSLVDWFRNQVPHHRMGFVFGPPGTGKTTELARRICASLTQNLRIIALAPTNRAADALYIRVLEQKKNSGLNDIIVQRFGPGAKESWLEEEMPCVVITTIHRFVFDKFINGNRLINTEWDYLVIDEASMIPLPYLMLPLVHGRFKKESHDDGGLKHQFTIAGDPFQLLPVGLTPSLGDLIDFEQHKNDSQSLRGFTTDNIYTLLQIDRFDIRHTNVGNNYVIDTLTHNYRSLPSIVHLFSRFLYLDSDRTEILTSNFEEDQKRSVLSDTILPVITLVNFPVKLYKTGKAHHVNSIYRYGNGAYHIYSALLATALVRQLLLDNPVKSIGLVSPYTRQVKLCEAMLKPILQTGSNRISVSTVHRFQGEEADIIILLLNPSSGTDTNDGQLISGYLSHFNNRNLLNVAISRPKSTLIVLKPEDVFLRSRNAGYVFNDEVALQNQIADLDIQHLHASQLEQILFGKEVLRKLAYLDTIRSFDVFRTQHLQEQNIDWVFLIGTKNLQVILAREVEKHLVGLNYS